MSDQSRFQDSQRYPGTFQQPFPAETHVASAHKSADLLGDETSFSAGSHYSVKSTPTGEYAPSSQYSVTANPLCPIYHGSATFLSNEIVQVLGLFEINELSQNFGVEVVKCSFCRLNEFYPSEVKYAVWGHQTGVEEFEKHLTRVLQSKASSPACKGVFYALNHGVQPQPQPQLQSKGDALSPVAVTQQPAHSQFNHPNVLQFNYVTGRYVGEFSAEEISKIEKKNHVRLKWDVDAGHASASVTVTPCSAQADVEAAKSQLGQVVMAVSSTLADIRLPMPDGAWTALTQQVDFKKHRTVAMPEKSGEGANCVIIGPNEHLKVIKPKVEDFLKRFRLPENCVASCSIRGRQITVKRGDLTAEKTDAIVNAANENLKHGGGVAKAISDAGGKTIQKESDQITKEKGGYVPTGQAVYTKGGNLPCKWVIHAVAPHWSHRDTETYTLAKLKQTCRSALALANDLHVRSVAIPGLGSGIYGIPKSKCAATLFAATEQYFEQSPYSSITDVVFINIDGETVAAFHKECKKWASGNPNPGKIHHSLENGLDSVSQHAKNTDDRSKECPVCLEGPTSDNPKKILPCKHFVCSACSKKLLKPVCPICQKTFGTVRGNQPIDAQMRCQVVQFCLPGYEQYRTIQIEYKIPSGTQTTEHPTPGKRYQSTTRTAYLPDNTEGRQVLDLLQKAFSQRLTFTIGRSVTTGEDGVVTWNDLHHKTSTQGGPHCYGYPDPNYLQRVRRELEAKGITDSGKKA
eukprot:m.39438 g.39438  ORF g.39438 m.39438 type:complete len:746 (+) comp32742_c0_seq1:448-2685(+)